MMRRIAVVALLVVLALVVGVPALALAADAEIPAEMGVPGWVAGLVPALLAGVGAAWKLWPTIAQTVRSGSPPPPPTLAPPPTHVVHGAEATPRGLRLMTQDDLDHLRLEIEQDLQTELRLYQALQEQQVARAEVAARAAQDAAARVEASTAQVLAALRLPHPGDGS